MDNRKRARLETPIEGSALASLGQQNFFLSSTSSQSLIGAQLLPDNVFLTICDDNEPNSEDEEDEETSGDFLTIDSNELAALALTHHQPHHIKHEQDQEMGTQTTPPQPPPPLQYRIVQQQNQRQTTTLTESASSASLVTLPNGCEIYLVKEYVASGGAESRTHHEVLATSAAGAASASTAAIKMEPGVKQFVRDSGAITTKGTTPSSVSAVAVGTSSQPEEGGNRKRSFILEAYKKRDDKRRATHNEVERRRRDKINSWIFKLKEMLPPDAATNCDSAPASVPACGSQQQQQQQKSNVNQNSNNNNSNSRTPPSDSKSQILIKACEYIKAMQQEIKSLRECLVENENLRLSNQRLQTELYKIKNERIHSRQQQQQFNVVTLNGLNGSGGLFGVVNSVAAATATGGAATLVGSHHASHATAPASVSYAKRELIIRDYVD